MSAPNNGGPARPHQRIVDGNGTIIHHAYPGVSIRTEIAMHVMTTLIGDANVAAFPEERYARFAAGWADVLIAELTKDGGAL